MKKLSTDFYLRPDVVQIAKDLLGKKLCTFINGELTSGIITETEAYEGIIDKASHAYSNRRTERTQTMYESGGLCYIYLCYGIHHLFNVVTNVKDTPHAVLIRAVKPVEGIETMLQRRKLRQAQLPKQKSGKILTSGPGTLSQALGITASHNATKLSGKLIWIEDAGITLTENQIIKTTRIGVDYAKEHALWNYRFYIKDEEWISKK